MTDINAKLVLDSIEEKMSIVSSSNGFRDWYDKDFAMQQLLNLRNEILLMVKVKEFYNDNPINS